MKIVREGKCLECGVRIAVYADGSRTKCGCVQPRRDTEQDKHFAQSFEDAAKRIPKPRN